jgi:hypothetical protein
VLGGIIGVIVVVTGFDPQSALGYAAVSVSVASLALILVRELQRAREAATEAKAIAEQAAALTAEQRAVLEALRSGARTTDEVAAALRRAADQIESERPPAGDGAPSDKPPRTDV